MASPVERLRELGLTMPTVAAPAGAYVPARRTGSLVFTAGQVPFVDGVWRPPGRWARRSPPSRGTTSRGPAR